MGSGEWRVESGEWGVGSGEWRVENGEWSVECGVWRAILRCTMHYNNIMAGLTQRGDMSRHTAVGTHVVGHGHRHTICIFTIQNVLNNATAPKIVCRLKYFFQHPQYSPPEVGGTTEEGRR